MMRVNLLPKSEPKSDYVLKLVDLSVQKRINPRKATARTGGFFRFKKAIAGLLAIMFIIAGTAAGLTLTTSTTNQKTDAANAFAIWDTDWWCSVFGGVNADDPRVMVGGSSNAVNAGMAKTKNNIPALGGGFLFPALPKNVTVDSSKPNDPLHALTALEMYSYWSPSFDFWVKAYPKLSDGGARPFYGTGGASTSLQYGQGINVGRHLPWYAQNFGECAGNWGGAFSAGFGNFIFALPKFWVAISSEVYTWASNAHIAKPLQQVIFPGSSTTASDALAGAAKNDTNLWNGGTTYWEDCDPNSSATTDKCQSTFAANPMGMLGNIVNNIIAGTPGAHNGLRDTLFMNFLIPVILLAVIGIMYNGIIKKGFMKTVQGAAWMLIGIILGGLFLIAPLAPFSIVEAFTTTAKDAVTEGISQMFESSNIEGCTLPTNSDQLSSREVRCVVWYTTIYTPWVQGQFGMNTFDANYKTQSSANVLDANGDGLNDTDQNGSLPNQSKVWFCSGNCDGIDGLGYTSTSINPALNHSAASVFSHWTSPYFNNVAGVQSEWPKFTMNWPFYQMDISANYETADGTNYSEIAWSQLALNNNSTWQSASGAVGSSFLSLLGALAPGLLLLVYSAAILMWMLTELILIIIAPMVFLIGIIPGYGRRIVARWAEVLVSLLVKQLMACILINVWAAMYIAIFAQGSAIIWIFQQAIVALLTMVFITQRDKLIGLFTDPIRFGGGGAGGGLLSDFSGSMSNRVGGLAAGAVGFAAGTAAKGIRRAQSRKDSLDNAKAMGNALRGQGKDRGKVLDNQPNPKDGSKRGRGGDNPQVPPTGGGSDGGAPDTSLDPIISGGRTILGPDGKPQAYAKPKVTDPAAEAQEKKWQELLGKDDYGLKRSDYKKAFTKEERKQLAGLKGDERAKKANELMRANVDAKHKAVETSRGNAQKLADDMAKTTHDDSLSPAEKAEKLKAIKEQMHQEALQRQADLQTMEKNAKHLETKTERAWTAVGGVAASVVDLPHTVAGAGRSVVHGAVDAYDSTVGAGKAVVQGVGEAIEVAGYVAKNAPVLVGMGTEALGNVAKDVVGSAKMVAGDVAEATFGNVSSAFTEAREAKQKARAEAQEWKRNKR